MLKIETKLHAAVFVAASTALSVGMSLLVTALIFAGEPPARSLFIAGSVPAMVAPLCASVMALLAMRISKANTLLRYQADHDGLTGLFNRRRFFEILTGVEKDRPGTVFMIDIDNFKGVNDTYGHGAGDAVLKGVATCLKQTLQEDAVISRLGGEEFVVFLPDVQLAQGAEVAETLRTAIAALPPLADPGPEQVTVSIGVSVRNPTREIDADLLRADKALYLAKRTGKDRMNLAKKTTKIPDAV